MAARKKRNNRRFLWLGCLGLAAVLTALLFIATSLPAPTPELPTQITTLPPETDHPAPTLPPNPYGLTDFQYENNYLTCLAGESRLGIDVSNHQGDIDWTQVSDAGMQFAMIRVGYRGYESGAIQTDEQATVNLDGAQQAGLDAGVYFFSQAVSVAEAEEEAEFVLSFLAGRTLEMPVVFDWEYISADARTGAMDAETLTQCAKAFCEKIKSAGYEPMVYFNSDQAVTHYILTELTDYGFWLALYNERMTFPYKVDIWQYTQEGTVPGIATPVDIDLQFLFSD